MPEIFYIARQIDFWIDPQNGQSEEHSDAYKVRIKDYEKLTTEQKDLRWTCEILSDKFCNGIGRLQYLLNTSDDTDYVVTIKTDWSYNSERGSYRRSYKICSGDRIRLGCAENSENNPTRYFRKIVNERVSPCA